MRWKLLVLMSIAAALVACGLWSAFTLVFFQTAGELTAHRLIFIAGTLVPLIVAGTAGVFIYRHTARRRKLQAVLTAVLTLLLSLAMYTLAMRFWSSRYSNTQVETYDTRYV